MSFDGAFYKVPRVRVNPKPVQKPHPPLWTAAVSPDTYTLAAKRGLKILTSPAFTPLDILRKNYDAYHAEWQATHGTGEGAEICMNKIIHVAETSKQAREDLREPVLWFFRTQADLIADPQGAPPEQYKFYKRVRENLLSLTEEKALDLAAIAGDAEDRQDPPAPRGPRHHPLHGRLLPRRPRPRQGHPLHAPLRRKGDAPLRLKGVRS